MTRIALSLALLLTGCGLQLPGGAVSIGQNASMIWTRDPNGGQTLVMDQDQATGLADAVSAAVAAYGIKGRVDIKQGEELTERTGISEGATTDRAAIGAGVESERIRADVEKTEILSR